MGNPFSSVISNARSGSNDRHFGGSTESIVADPYISGYHYIDFISLPSNLIDFASGASKANMSSQEDIKYFLAGSCLSVTPPGGTLNKTEFTGIGGVKWAVPTNIDYGTSLTVKFLEFSSLPVLSIMHGWVKMIRDYKGGVSNLSNTDNSYTKSAYTASMYYWTTKPDGKTVEYCACYTGMFPSKDPQELFSGDVTAVDKLEVDIEFNVDWIWHEPWVLSACQARADILSKDNNPTSGYRGQDGKGNGVDNV